MALADNLIAATASAFNIVHADTWTILGPGALAGLTFVGEVQTEAPVILDTELGSDAREKSVLYVSRPAPDHVLSLKRNMALLGKGAQWTVIGEVDDNPANQHIKFEILKKASVDS